MTEKFEFIDAEYAAYQESEQGARAVDRENVHLDGGVPLRVLRMAERAGIGDGEKARDPRAVRAEVIRGFR